LLTFSFSFFFNPEDQGSTSQYMSVNFYLISWHDIPEDRHQSESLTYHNTEIDGTTVDCQYTTQPWPSLYILLLCIMCKECMKIMLFHKTHILEMWMTLLAHTVFKEQHIKDYWKKDLQKHRSSVVMEQKCWHCMEIPEVWELLPGESANGVQMHLPQPSMVSPPIWSMAPKIVHKVKIIYIRHVKLNLYRGPPQPYK
jgi:hypothetical protein